MKGIDPVTVGVYSIAGTSEVSVGGILLKSVLAALSIFGNCEQTTVNSLVSLIRNDQFSVIDGFHRFTHTPDEYRTFSDFSDRTSKVLGRIRKGFRSAVSYNHLVIHSNDHFMGSWLAGFWHQLSEIQREELLNSFSLEGPKAKAAVWAFLNLDAAPPDQQTLLRDVAFTQHFAEKVIEVTSVEELAEILRPMLSEDQPSSTQRLALAFSQ